MKTMKTTHRLAGSLAALLLVAGGLAAQERKDTPMTPVKVTVVFTESDGSKKVSSLPYVLQVNATTDRSANRASLRMGLRVPIREGRTMQGQQPAIAEVTEYEDVGTDIDCNVQPREGGLFLLELNANRSSVYAPQRQQGEGFGEKPVFSGLRVNQTLLMHDGETAQAAMSTDPISGNVTKVEVTLNIVK